MQAFWVFWFRPIGAGIIGILNSREKVQCSLNWNDNELQTERNITKWPDLKTTQILLQSNKTSKKRNVMQKRTTKNEKNQQSVEC